jgi:hypothetical protein
MSAGLVDPEKKKKEFNVDEMMGGRAGHTLTNSAHDLKKPAGLSTCSTTSIEQTISNRFGSCTSVSAVTCRNASVPDADADAASRAKLGSAAA